MANRIPWYKTFEWKNITGGIAVLAIISALLTVIFLPDLVKRDKLDRYDGETSGTVTSITENTRMEQGHEGTKIYVASYTVQYNYQVGQLKFESSEDIRATPNSSKFMTQVRNKGQNQLIIKYDKSEPSKSTILVK